MDNYPSGKLGITDVYSTWNANTHSKYYCHDLLYFSIWGDKITQLQITVESYFWSNEFLEEIL